MFTVEATTQKFIEGKREGQAMLLVTFMIGGLFMMATAIAGLLMFYQLQQATDAGDSTIAIYAADAALEKAAYYYFYTYAYDIDVLCQPPPCRFFVTTIGGPALSNGADSSAELVIAPPTMQNATTTITARGYDAGRRTIRLLQTTFISNPFK